MMDANNGKRQSGLSIIDTVVNWIFYILLIIYVPAITFGLYLAFFRTELRAERTILLLLFLIILISITLFPALMILSYKRIHEGMIKLRVGQALWLCGVENQDFNNYICEFEKRNSDQEFRMPAIVLTLLLTAFWALAMAPRGLDGYLSHASRMWQPVFNGKLYFDYVIANSSLVTWVFMGAYTYIVTNLLLSWGSSDITTAALWSYVTRMFLVLFLAMLVRQVDVSNNSITTTTTTYRIIGFLGGIVPNSIFSWLLSAVKSVFNVSTDSLPNLFKPSELQQKISGIDFSKAGRLSIEGIDSVENLANTDFVKLLINTRFDIQNLLSWIDQAILYFHCEDKVIFYHNAGIRTATGLVDCVTECGAEKVHEAIQDAYRFVATMASNQEIGDAVPITSAMLEVQIAELKRGSNLPYLHKYYENTETIEKRNARLSTIPPLYIDGALSGQHKEFDSNISAEDNVNNSLPVST